MTDTELKLKALQLLSAYLGDLESERFVALIQREPFDYTKWRADQWDDMSIADISEQAMNLRNNGTRN